MADKEPYWFHLTVPHSGTRFINDTFDRSGYFSNSVLPKEKREAKGVRLGWNHYMGLADPDHRDKVLAAVDDADVKWTTVRDPIMTMKTHWARLEEEPTIEQRQRAATNRMDRMVAAYTLQNKYFDRVDRRAYRVDRDDLSLLEEWTGAKLIVPGKTHTRHGESRLTKAVKERDIHSIRFLTNGTDYWERWIDECTPIFKDFYEDLGYDIWWE